MTILRKKRWDHKFLRGKTNQNVLTNIYKNTAFKYMYIGLVDTNLKAYSRFLCSVNIFVSGPETTSISICGRTKRPENQETEVRKKNRFVCT